MTFSWFLFVVLIVVLIFLPVFWACRMVALYLFAKELPPTPEGALPRALVLLPVRGADPSLKACLTGLCTQQYPSYAVRIVVDSADDPAWQYVNEVLAEHPEARDRVQVEALARPLPSCSAKVAAQLQVLGSLDPSFEIVAFIDADSIPGPDWLRALALPLADAGVGATSGVRWFVPADDKWGSWVRHGYNAASFTQMYAFHIPWGGSMAMRTDVMRRTGILEHWAHCFCEDTATYTVLRKSGLSVTFVPQATQFNQESIDLPSAYRFVLRQLLCVRLHHVHWPAIMTANLGNTLALLVSLGLVGANLATGRWEEAALWGGLLAAYACCIMGTLTVAESLIRQTARQRGEPAPMPPATWKRLPAAILTQFFSFLCIIYSNFLRDVRWRGITYQIFGPDNIRMMRYATYQGTSSNQSII